MSQLNELSFTVSGYVARPTVQTYEAVADPERLSQYFTTAGARGRLESGAEVTWEFADFPGPFPVQVLEAVPHRRIVIRWQAPEATDSDGHTTVVFEFEPIDDDTRTLVTITESSWNPTEAGAKNAFGNCMGWTAMLASMKAWIEYGIHLREGFHR